MQNFNTQAGFRNRLSSHEQVFKASPLPNGLKTWFAATVAVLLLCCFSFQAANAQCNPDITAPTAVCEGPFTIALNTNGNAPINPDDIDAGSFDNCGAVTLAVSPSSVNCTNLGTFSVVLTVTDLAGNTNTCLTIVTIVDNLPPAIICPGPATVTCGSSTLPAATGFATAIDNCGGNLAQAGIYCPPAPPTMPSFPAGITYCDGVGGCAGGFTRTWRATYDGLTSAPCTQNIIINDTEKPVIDWDGSGTAGNGSGPANTSISCSAALPAAVVFPLVPGPADPRVIDNCDTSPTPTFVETTTRIMNPNVCLYYSYTITRTYGAIDDCGNTAIPYVHTITVVDNSAPVITAPATVNISAGVNCTANVIFPAVTVSDNCAAPANILTSFVVTNNVTGLVVNSGSGLNPSAVYAAGAYTVSFLAHDPCGNPGVATTALNVVDNVAPTAVCVAGSIQVSIPPTGTTTLTAAQVNNGSFDNCTPANMLTFTLTNATFNCTHVGTTQTVTLNVTDTYGNMNTCTATVNIVNNSPPAIFCKNLTVNLDAMGNVIVNAIQFDNGSSDICDATAPLTFEYMSVNGVTLGVPATSFTFNCGHVTLSPAPAIPVVIRVTEVDDDQSPNYTNSGTCSQTIRVQDVTPPTPVCNTATFQLDDDGMISVFDAGTTLTPFTNGTDVSIPDNDIIIGASSVINVPTLGTVSDVNVLVDINHTFIGDLIVTLTSPAGTTVTIFDRPGSPPGFGCGADDLSTTFDDQASLTATDFETACVANNAGTYRPLVSFSAFEGENFQGDWTLRVYDAAGVDLGIIDSWSLTLTNSLVDLLAAGSTDNCNVAWSVAPTMFNCSDVGDQDLNAMGIQNNDYILTVTDPSGNTASINCTNAIVIQDMEAPVVTCAPITVSTGMLNPVTNISTPGQVTVYPTDVVTGGLYMSTSNTGSGNPGTNNFQITMPNVLTFTFDWSYVSNNSSPIWDKFGYYVGTTFTQLTNNNGPLSQSGTATVSVTAGATFGFRAETVDNLGGNAEIWITKFSPRFAGPFKPSNWTHNTTSPDGKQFFYDACGFPNWAISANGGPFAAFATFDCASITALPNPEDIVIRATDASGNITVCSTTVTVVDKEAPQAQCQPLLVSLPGSGTATILASDINFGSSDACSPPVFLATSKNNGANFNLSTTFNCSNIGPNNVILRVRDSATPPNEAFCQTTVTINDQLPPAITCPPNRDGISLPKVNCDQSIDPNSTGWATATDNCNASPFIWHTDSPLAPGSHANCRTITRTWKATDAAVPNGNQPTNGNISVCFQTIIVQDLVFPNFDWNGALVNGLGNAPNDTFLYACVVPAAAIAVGTDNCDTDVPVAFTVPVNTKGSNPAICSFYNYNITRRWTASDNCGNPILYEQDIVVSDTTRPAYSFPAMFMFNNNAGNCAGTANINLLQYITDCAAGHLTVTYKIDGGAPQTGGTLNAVLSVGSHNIRVSAVDPCANTTNAGLASITFTILIKDTESPTAICQSGPISVTLNSNGIANITPATVNNGSNDNCGIASLNVNPATFNCFTTPNPHTVTLTVTDAAGNFNTCTTTVQILNVSAPTIQCPADITVACNIFMANNPATSGGSATAMTACGPVTPTPSDVIVSGSGNCRVINRTWSATTAGGTATCLQVITVQDNIAPVLVGGPANITVDACAVPMPAAVTATDNCATVTPTMAQSSTQDPNPANSGYYNYTITRTWNATDGCGNNAVPHVQTITVQDVALPVLAIPDPLIINTDPNKCEANVNVNLLSYISDCAADQYLVVTNNAPSGPGTSLIAGIYAAGNYTITVNANDPSSAPAGPSTQTFVLSIRDGQSPVAICLTDITVVLDNTGNATITSNEVNNGSYDNCGIASITLSQYNFNTSHAGLAIPVTMTVTDLAGNTNTCVVIVHVVDDPTFRVNSVTAVNGEMKLIPVTVNQFDDIVSFEMDFDIDDIGVATLVDIVDIDPSLAGPSFIKTITAGHGEVSWIDNAAPFGVYLADGTVAFNLKVMVVGAAGSATDIDINNLEVAQEIPGVVPSLGLTGTLTVVDPGSSFTVSGELRGRPDCAPGLISQANVNYVGTLTGVLTNVPGTYSLNVPAGANETFTPTKGAVALNPNITAADALAAHNYAAGTPNPPLTPYQIVACDANNSNSVTAYDAFLIHQMSAGYSVNLPKYWRFVPVTPGFAPNSDPFAAPFNEFISLTNINANINNADFYGMKVGDVVNTAGSGVPCNSFGGNPISDGNGNDVVLRIQDQPISAGSDVYVTLKAKEFNQMVTCQATLNFDAQSLQYQEVVPGNVPNMNQSCFNPMLTGEGMLAAVWYNSDAVSLDNGQEVFTVKFKALKDAASLTDLIWVSADFVPIEALSADGVPGGVQLTFDGSASATGEQASSHFALHQNRPNPFSTRTAIGFNLPTADHATLTITDASGKSLKVVEGNFTAGYHQFMIERKELPATGVFFYQLKTAEFQAVKKMILVD
ncbi:MAG: proprotein convertase P-domain-containing protein [Saprospiraceae bacterium]|nr:proprotein convertase P-domain-containing protein [Saprospiraceae bacterium]MCF8250745.1 proprotein convertase P-domain-containing protein [Saprospiraceae bacterium]MCF8279802.1 proprotein convertase P-domain-containing protein [Bacteroidales bacterium]MCF8310493.1 proprotein convertase P-domain-containing protein [Saprospiraceae bacterium]MCF8440875.1 proprotein convertase P-domain-containing protein [Saprospiraceae bacterium]